MTAAQRAKEKLILINSLLRAMPRRELYVDHQYCSPKDMARTLDARAEAILEQVEESERQRCSDSPLMDAVEDHLEGSLDDDLEKVQAEVTSLAGQHGYPKHLVPVLMDVLRRRVQQHKKWGERSLPPVAEAAMGRSAFAAEHYGVPTAEAALSSRENRLYSGDLAWADVLVEKVAEVIGTAACGGDADLQADLIDVAAVVAGWLEDIRVAQEVEANHG